MCGRIGHNRKACPQHIRETTNDMGNDQSQESNSKGDTTPIHKGVEKNNEGCGDWMVVSRCKPSSKNAAKFRGSEVNYTVESSQASSVNLASRALGYDKIDGKRKASHLLPNNAPRETDRMHRSSRRLSGP